MTDDLISRQAAIDALLHNQEGYFKNFPDVPMAKYAVAIIDNDAQTIAQLPSAQTERKQGKWIYYPKANGSVTSTAVHIYPVCSECGCEHPVASYCPNCGAVMGERREDVEETD